MDNIKHLDTNGLYIFDPIDFEVDINIELDSDIEPPIKINNLSNIYINYSNAEQLANNIDLKRNNRYFSFISGNFIFGDLIEALVVVKNYKIKEMTISTLSLSEENIYNLVNIINGDYVDKLNIIISDYFYSHERQKLVKKMYELLNTSKCEFQLSVARSHMKVCIFETSNENNGYVVIQGSANLRSSGNIEQIQIEENKELYLHIKKFNDKIIDKYKTIKKSIGNKKDFEYLKI